MTIAHTAQNWLDQHGVHYEVLTHAPTTDSAHSAEAAHVPGHQLAKSVLLQDPSGYLMAIVPATHRVDCGALHRQLDRPLGLATEREVATLFSDCEAGAVPALGQAYGIDVIVDDALADAEDVYFEGGDHRTLVHLQGSDFRRMMAGAGHGRFSRRMPVRRGRVDVASWVRTI